MAELDLRPVLGEAFERLDQAGRLKRKSSPITRQDHQPYPTSPIGATMALSVVKAIHFPPLPERRPSKTWRAYLHARLQDVLHLANIYLSHSSRLLAMVYRMSKVLRARTAEHVILRSLHSTRVNPAFTSLSEPGGDDEGMDWEVRQRHQPLVSRCVAEEVYVTT